MGDFTFNPFSPDLISDPNPTYLRLLEEAPVHWNPAFQAWVFTRLDDVREVLSDPGFVPVNSGELLMEIAQRANLDFPRLAVFLDAVLFFQVGEEHKQDRRTIVQVINRKPLSHWTKVARAIAEEYRAELSTCTQYDVVARFAEQLPHRVMGEILGFTTDETASLVAALCRDH